MPTRAELLAGAEVESKKIQEEAKANPSDLLASLGAAFATQNQTLAKGLNSQEDFGKLLEIVSPTGIGTLMGKGAKTWNAHEAELATKLEELGSDAKSIWRNTGTYKGPIDGLMRQEIPDIDAALKPFTAKAGARVRLGDMLEHKKLFEAYPELADIPVVPGKGFAFGKGSDGGALMSVDPKMLKEQPQKFLNILLHEVQHGIQNIEGFTRGSSPERAMATTEYKAMIKGIDLNSFDSPENIQNTLRRMADRIYRKVGGEAEARAVQARQYYDPADLKNIMPTDSYDTALHALIKAPK